MTCQTETRGERSRSDGVSVYRDVNPKIEIRAPNAILLGVESLNNEC